MGAKNLPDNTALGFSPDVFEIVSGTEESPTQMPRVSFRTSFGLAVLRLGAWRRRWLKRSVRPFFYRHEEEQFRAQLTDDKWRTRFPGKGGFRL